MSFPENYIYRIVISYLKLMKKKYHDINNSYYKIIQNYYSYKKMIVSNESISNYNYKVNSSLEYAKEILYKLDFFIKNSDVFNDIIFLRKRTIMFWYTREAFKYGTNSHKSMLYSRNDLDILTESFFILNYILLENNIIESNKVFTKVIDLIGNLIDIHKTADLLSSKEYKSKLENIQKKLVIYTKEIYNLLN